MEQSQWNYVYSEAYITAISTIVSVSPVSFNCVHCGVLCSVE